MTAKDTRLIEKKISQDSAPLTLAQLSIRKE